MMLEPRNDDTTRCAAARYDASRSSEAGFGLLAALLVMLMISTMGAALMLTATTDLTVSDNYRASKIALYEADAGLERSIVDFVTDPNWVVSVVNPTLPVTAISPFPNPITINGHTFTIPLSGGNPVPDYYSWGGTVTLGGGTYTRSVFLPPTSFELANGKGSKAWMQFPLRAIGTGGVADTGTQVVEADARVMVHRISIWDNAVFAGEGQSGATITGNAHIRGSVHIVGDPANPTVFNWNGGGGVRNNYLDAADNQFFGADAWKLPSLPLREFEGEMVQTLDTDVRVNHGQISLDGNTDLGQPHVGGNAFKETIDGVYTDQPILYGSATSEVFADLEGEYDISVNVPFPTLDDPYVDPATGTAYAQHRTFLDTQSLTIPYNDIDAGTPAFALTDGTNSIAWDPATRTMTIDGVIRVAGDLTLGQTAGGLSRINYVGTGTVYATQDIEILWEVVPVGGYLDSALPNGHNLGLIADRDMDIATTAQIEMFAALYAEEDITFARQTRIAGAAVANYFDMGTNVPAIWQVPRLSGKLPPGMPGADPLVFPNRVQLANWTHAR